MQHDISTEQHQDRTAEASPLGGRHRRVEAAADVAPHHGLLGTDRRDDGRDQDESPRQYSAEHGRRNGALATADVHGDSGWGPTDDACQERTVATAGPGAPVGASAGLLGRSPTQLDVQIITNRIGTHDEKIGALRPPRRRKSRRTQPKNSTLRKSFDSNDLHDTCGNFAYELLTFSTLFSFTQLEAYSCKPLSYINLHLPSASCLHGPSLAYL
jgi:hypothetical protein